MTESKIVYFQSINDHRYQELHGDRPARRRDGTMALLKDMTDDGETIEVFIESGWVPGWVRGEPNRFDFVISVTSFEDEKTVWRVLEDCTRGFYNRPDSPMPWTKIIPPSKQCTPGLPETSFVVIAREDRQETGEKGRYTLATRSVFDTEEDAKRYAEGISTSREPLVIPGRFGQLRAK